MEEKLLKIESIINSCTTYNHVRTCFSFTKNTFIGEDAYLRYQVMSLIHEKLYKMKIEGSIDDIQGKMPKCFGF